jgi:hypothetical protein
MALKRISMYGLEIEAFTLDCEGRLVNGGPKVLKSIAGTRLEKYAKKEISKCMVELVAKEKRRVKDAALAFLDNLESLVQAAAKQDCHLLPLGTHPGRTLPKLESSEWYSAKKAVLGNDTFKEGRIAGFHFHYTLPEGIVERSTQRIRTVGRSHARDIFLQQYNFLVAADPAILTFCQSTPFWMGYHWAKDSRVLVYRDMRVDRGARSMHGIHHYLPIFGALPSYEFALEDLRVMADTRKTEWLKVLEQRRFPTNNIACYPTLKFMWGPIRVNKIGTFEYRGPDMNHPSVIFATSRLLVYALQAIEKQGIKVLPSDIGAAEPFVLEGDTIYVPPHSTLKHLEYQSVVNGFGAQSVKEYCKALYDLVEQLTGKAKRLGRVKGMLDSGMSVSDEILAMVKKNGYDLDAEVPEDMLNHIALYHADRLPMEIDAARKYVEQD